MIWGGRGNEDGNVGLSASLKGKVRLPCILWSGPGASGDGCPRVRDLSRAASPRGFLDMSYS